jgi:hypothetical protein
LDDPDFSDEFCGFLHATVPSVSAAELLLTLVGQPDRWWDAPAAIAMQPPGATLPESDAKRYFEVFAAGGVVQTDEEGRVQYRPASPVVDGHVRSLERAYNERPVTLIRMIYALRDSRIRSFADAFKFRKR